MELIVIGRQHATTDDLVCRRRHSWRVFSQFETIRIVSSGARRVLWHRSMSHVQNPTTIIVIAGWSTMMMMMMPMALE
jgi:hypothetical protein